MTTGKSTGPRVPTEHPDPQAAARDAGGDAEDRPGFDLGGAKDVSPGGGQSTIPGGPKGSAGAGTTATGRASGFTDLSGSRSLGNEGDAGSDAGSGPPNGSGGPT